MHGPGLAGAGLGTLPGPIAAALCLLLGAVNGMIKRKTVLILGAGASMHLAFPSGRQLVTKVIDGLRQENYQLFQILRACGFPAPDITGFRDALERSGRSSVDVFLEHRPEFLPLGKTAIAGLLMPAAPSSW